MEMPFVNKITKMFSHLFLAHQIHTDKSNIGKKKLSRKRLFDVINVVSHDRICLYTYRALVNSMLKRVKAVVKE